MKFLQQSLSLPVKRLDSFESFRLAADVPMAQFSENVPSLGVACGLALQGIGLGVITSNLLPREIARQGLWHRKRPFFVAASAVVLISSLLCVFQAHSQQRDIENTKLEQQTIVQRIKQIKELSKDKNKFLGQAKMAQAEIAKRAELYRTPNIVPQLLQAIRSYLPNQDTVEDSVQKQMHAAFLRGDRDGVMAVPRGEREQIFVSRIEFVYTDDLDKLFSQVAPTAGGSRQRGRSESGSASSDKSYDGSGGSPMSAVARRGASASKAGGRNGRTATVVQQAVPGFCGYNGRKYAAP